MIDASAKWFRRLLLASIYVLGVLGIVGSGGGDNEFASGTITVNPITADDVVNAAEAAGIINVTGSVRGLPESFFGNVNFLVNGTAYFGPASPNFSIKGTGFTRSICELLDENNYPLGRTADISDAATVALDIFRSTRNFFALHMVTAAQAVRICSEFIDKKLALAALTGGLLAAHQVVGSPDFDRDHSMPVNDRLSDEHT